MKAIDWVREVLRALWCGLVLGHPDQVAELTPTELFLRCPHCGRRSHGWTVGPLKAARFLPGDPERHRMIPRRPCLPGWTPDQTERLLADIMADPTPQGEFVYMNPDAAAYGVAMPSGTVPLVHLGKVTDQNGNTWDHFEAVSKERLARMKPHGRVQ